MSADPTPLWLRPDWRRTMLALVFAGAGVALTALSTWLAWNVLNAPWPASLAAARLNIVGAALYATLGLIGLVLTGLNWMGRKIAPRHALWFVAVPAALCAVAGLALEYADLFGVIQISEQRYRNGLFLCFPFLAIGYLIHSRIKAPGARPLPSARLLLPVTLAGLVLMGVEAWLVQSRLGLDVMIEIPFAGYVAVPALFLLCLQVEMPPQPVDLGLISATIYFLHVWAFRLADVLGIHSLPGLMLMGVGVPVLAALSYGAASGRLRGRAARRPHGG